MSKTPLQRVQAEYEELLTKLDNLKCMLSCTQPSFINDLQWSLLQIQYNCMLSYSVVLEQRLDNWYSV